MNKAEPTKPKGRIDIMNAVLAAADNLFEAKGPDAVTVREVAAEAKVNHALVHRHFGTKQGLLRHVISDHAKDFERAAARAQTPVEAAGDLFDVINGRPAIARIFAHLVLNGHAAEEIVDRHEGTGQLAEMLTRAAATDATAPSVDPRISAAFVTALSMGWCLFEDFLLYCVEYDEPPERARATVRGLLEQIIDAGSRPAPGEGDG